jgi:6-phosphogluconolactonase
MVNEHALAEDQLIPVLGQTLCELIVKMQLSQNSVSLALAGGNTPAPLYRWLSEQHINWGRCKITLSDERWLSPDQPDSNELLIRENLLINQAQYAYFCPLKNAQKTALEGQQECETNLSINIPTLDIALLGMGEDGHFASIFPGQDDFENLINPDNSALCRALQPPHAPHERMTLTLAYLLSAKRIFILFKGAKKIRLYEQAKQAIHHVDQFPLRVLLSQQKVPVDVYWSL